jgi:hypothetical protein
LIAIVEAVLDAATYRLGNSHMDLELKREARSVIEKITNLRDSL